MALLGNGFAALSPLPLTYVGGATGVAYPHNLRTMFGRGDRCNQQSRFGKLASVPNGVTHPIAWILPYTAGNISSRSAVITISPSANGLMGKLATATTSFSIYTNTPNRLPVNDSPPARTATTSFSISANNSARLPVDDTPPARTASTSFSIYTNTPTRLPVDDTPPARTATTSFSIYTNVPHVDLIAILIGNTNLSIVTNSPIVYPLNDTPQIRTATTSFSISANNSARLPVDDTPPARTATTSFNVVSSAFLSALTDLLGSAAFSISANNSARLPVDDTPPARTATTSFSIYTNTPNRLPVNDYPPARTATTILSFSGALTAYAIGNMVGSTDVVQELTVESIAREVWNSYLLDYQNDGSAGKALSTASSGGVDLELLAQAVITALQAITIPVDVKKMNSSTLLGDGTENNKWRGAGV